MPLCLIALVAVFSGCTTNRAVSQPGTITLEAALKSVGQGLHDLNAAEGNIRTGLYPETVQLTFNISASSATGGGLTIDLTGGVPQIPVSGTAGGSFSNNFTGQRGNQITIIFKNILDISPTNSLMSKPADVQTMLNIIGNTNSLGQLNMQ